MRANRGGPALRWMRRRHGATPAEEDFTGAFQPYNVPIAGEPVPGQGTMLAMADPNDPYGLLAPSSASVVQLANRQACQCTVSYLCDDAPARERREA